MAASAPLLFLLLLVALAGAQDVSQCLANFKIGRQGFILDVDDSVRDGATFLSSPKLTRQRDCQFACCKEPRCNVVFMKRGDGEGSVESCALFDCLYKKEYVCKFVNKQGFINYILDSVYEEHLAVDAPRSESDRPPSANGGPDQVVQPRDTVALNGIESKDDNKIESWEWKMISGEPNARIEKSDLFPDQILVSNLFPGVYKFQLTVKDTIGQSDSTTVTVLVLTPEQSEHHCMAPKKIGPCRGSFPRFHYNAASGRCEKFIFGGCKENLNNYISMDECTKACNGSEENKGTGRGLHIPGNQEEQCGAPCTPDQFSCANGCCLDPGLECDGKAQCSDSSDEQKCEEVKLQFEDLRNIPVDEKNVRCKQPPDTGNCKQSFTKWYYRPEDMNCFRFNYGGCPGNDNRFDSKEDCESVCHGVTGSESYVWQGRVSEGNTGVVAIAVVLGVAIALLLGVLVYCLMRRKKKTPSSSY